MSVTREESINREEINSEWQLDTTSATASRDSDFDNTYYASNGHDLYVVQKRERTSSRCMIPATKCEKLTYIRSYVSSTSKTDAIGIPTTNYNRLFWHYLQGTILRTLPSCYMYIFLGSYAPEHHLFLSKMLPLMHGLKILWIFVGLMQLYFSSGVILDVLNLTISGALYQEPWNRCNERFYYYNDTDGITSINITVFCYTMDQMIKKVSNKSIKQVGVFFFDPDTKEYFQLSQQFYLASHSTRDSESYALNISLFLIFWATSSLLINQIFKKYIWKILHVAHWMLGVFFACVLIFFCYFAAINNEINTVYLQPTPVQNRLVKLSTDSAIIITSNTIFYLLRAYVLDKLLRYCVLITKVQLHLVLGSPFYFLWSIFFWSVYLGRIITIPFYILIFVVDYLTFTITYQCLIEVIVCEWQFIKKWQAAITLCVLAFLLTQPSLLLVVVWLIVVGIQISTCIELLIISFIYPFGRILEDITFHNGIAPSCIVVLGLRFMFMYYEVRFIHLIIHFGEIVPLKIEWKTGIALTILLVFLIAILYKLYDIAIRNKKDWKLIIVPVQNWGPFDLTLRLLRKKYDSSKYIASQAPRELSRYFIQKAEPKSYRLDVIYSVASKSSQFVRPVNLSEN